MLMLSVTSSHRARSCDGISRRDALHAGMLGIGGLSLPWLWRIKAHAAAPSDFVRDKAVVLVFLSGGASHIETFHPNLTAPEPYRSVTGEVTTNVPGVTFGGTFGQLARHADKMAVVRSFQHSIGGHAQAIVHMLTGGTDPTGQGTQGFSMGAACTRIRGANNPRTGMPTYALLNSHEVDPQFQKERPRVEKGSRANGLGIAYGPFHPGGESVVVDNMSLNLSPTRLDHRRTLLRELDRLQRRVDNSAPLEGVEQQRQQAFAVLRGQAAEAFDISEEKPRIVRRYDTSRFSVGHRAMRPSQLGRHMLTARRLVEAGCGFVTVHSAGWDLHADSNNPGVLTGMQRLGHPLDHALSAFLEDLEQRGMLDDVLLVITGDFGRTPTINERGGRDHWPRLCTLALAGGGLNTGGVIGRSDRQNGEPASEPIRPPQLLGTILHTLFDVSALRLVTNVPRDLKVIVENASPIPELHT